MSFIRPLNDGPTWVDDADTEGLYVYSDGERIRYMPNTHEEFVEVAMRMLDQSGVLDEDELERVLKAFATRFRWRSTDTTRNITRSEASMGVANACVYCDEHGLDEERRQLQEIFETLERGDR